MVSTRQSNRSAAEGSIQQTPENDKDSESVDSDEQKPILRVGDIIIYKPYPYHDVVGPATITKIANDCYGELSAFTDCKMPTMHCHFKLVSSPHPDAPVVSPHFMHIDDVAVALEPGELEESVEELELARR